jgi:hypothetical protein
VKDPVYCARCGTLTAKEDLDRGCCKTCRPVCEFCQERFDRVDKIHTCPQCEQKIRGQRAE